MKHIRLAIAASFDNSVHYSCFTEADKFLIYDFTDFRLTFSKEIINYFKFIGENHSHVSTVDALTQMLELDEIKILVSSNFSGRIKQLSSRLIPCIINSKNLNDTIQKLGDCLKRLMNEFEGKQQNFHLYEYRNSLIKSII